MVCEMAPDLDYYQILQISPKADPAIVKAAYYTHLKTLKGHPDLGGNHDGATLLNEAYEILSDAERRKDYDKKYYLGFASPSSAIEANPFVPESELRKLPRAIFLNRFRFRHKKGEWVPAQFRDISLEGACFRTLAKFAQKETLDFDISENPFLMPRVEVRWGRVIPQRFGLPLYEGGVEFKEVDTAAFQKFLKLVGLEKVLGS